MEAVLAKLDNGPALPSFVERVCILIVKIVSYFSLSQSHTIKNIVGPAQSEKPESLILTVDGTQIKADKSQYQYTMNPVIERVPKPVSIVSGGIDLDVHGSDLNLLQRPKIVVLYEDQIYYGANCEVINEHLMVCMD